MTDRERLYRLSEDEEIDPASRRQLRCVLRSLPVDALVDLSALIATAECVRKGTASTADLARASALTLRQLSASSVFLPPRTLN